MLTFYPPIHPYAEHNIAVSPLHTLHVEECGDPDGLPILFLHGGPGVGCNPDHRRYFNPNRYRMILFDQRGAGRSTPHAELTENHTDALVNDIEHIRKVLGIEQFVIFGGSWGSTLALVYAEKHPERVIHLILRGIFLGREKDLTWLYQDGANQMFPDHWEAFSHHMPEHERNDLVESYYRRLTGHDEIARLAAAKHWCQWEGSMCTLLPNPDLVHKTLEPHTALSFARIGAHYVKHKIFLTPNQILQNIHRLQDIPGTIIHGRYDMVCTLDNAYALHQAWPISELQIIPDSGHSASEPGVLHALIHATNLVADRYV